MAEKVLTQPLYMGSLNIDEVGLPSADPLLLADTLMTVMGSGLFTDGHSAVTNELAHALHSHGLIGEQRRLFTDSHKDKVLAGTFGGWPDGPLYGTSGKQRNYSARNEFEFFAQLSNVYLGMNTGTDPYTGMSRNNGAMWVRRNVPKLLSLLGELYGPAPEAMHRWDSSPRSMENVWVAVRALWNDMESAWESEFRGTQTFGRAPIRPFSRAQLTMVARRIAGSMPRPGISVQRCLVLLSALRDALYPEGVRPAGTVDDAVLGDTRPTSALVMGPGWSAVGSWGALAGAVAAQGPGAVAFVLGRRQGQAVGHAWAAYHLGGFDGVMWLDLSAPDSRQVSWLPPGVAASDAQAMVVNPAGQAVEHALVPFAQSSSTAHSVLDAATARSYGAIGLEVEKRQVIMISGSSNVSAKQILAKAPGFKIVTEACAVIQTADGRLHPTYPRLAPGDLRPQVLKHVIGEIVMDPMAVLPGERRQPKQETLERLERLERVLDARDEPGSAPLIPLADLLPSEDGWLTTELGDRAMVGQDLAGAHRAYVQPTIGLPVLGLSLLQDRAVDRLPTGNPVAIVDVMGRLFAMRSTADFVRALTRRTDADVADEVIPFLAAIPDIDDMWGYLRFAYAHTVARPTGVILNQGPNAFVIKNGLAVASRMALDRVLRALRPRSRAFLDKYHDGISVLLAISLSGTLDVLSRATASEKPISSVFFDAAIGDAPSVREHTTSVLTGRTSEGKVVTQQQTVGMDDDTYPTLDTDDGRLDVPLVLAELRHFAYDGETLMTPEEIRRAVAELSQLSRKAYQRALLHRAPLPEDVLRESLSRILDNKAVQGLAQFVRVVLTAGLPQPDNFVRRLMSVGESYEVARALGQYALGTPMPAGHPVHQSLRTAIDEVVDAMETIPVSLQPKFRHLVDAARGAMEILADPDQTPPPTVWVSELVAVDGSRVLLDRVLVVRHRDFEGKPVGTSSRPLQEWQDGLRDSYALLPEVTGFTYVRRGPVAGESPVQTLPFEGAYVVGLRGGPAGAALALSDGTDAVFDYVRIVDFLYAVDGDLTALPPERPVLVAGADLAGPLPADPLETPLAGQILANGLDRWVWVTGSGLEPLIAPADGRAGPRLQLAEGDWWAGFRPEPSSAELARWAELITGDRGRVPDVRRWVRAIRLIYGPTIDDQGTALISLLGGFKALEDSRAACGLQSPLTWRDLRSAISFYFAAGGQVEPPLPVGLKFLLVSAAGSVGVVLELSGQSIIPRHQSLRAWDRATTGGSLENAGGAIVSEELPDAIKNDNSSLRPVTVTIAMDAPVVPSPVSGVFAGSADPLLLADTLITG
ncbi:hypothetical protein ACIP5U_40075, partial [Streptomyces sp. NPDC088788]